MAGHGGPLGNQYGAKSKQWSAAIERALDRRGDPTADPDVPLKRTPRARALDELAEKFIATVEATAANVDMSGFRELGDRLDGKPAQAVTLAGDADSPLVVKFENADERA